LIGHKQEPAVKSHATAQKSAHSAKPNASHSAQPFFQKQAEQRAGNAAKGSLQQQLVTGHPGDAYEREADAMADAATAPTPASDRPEGRTLHQRITPLIQRQAASEQEEEPVQAQAEAKDEEEPVQTQAEAKDEEEPVQAQAEAKQEEEPVQAQAEAKQEEEPVQAQAEAKDEEEPVQAQAEAKDEEEPVQAQAKDEEEPVQAQAEAKDEEEPVQAQAEAKDEEEPVQAQAEAKDEEEPVQAQADSSVIPPAATDVQEQLRSRRGQGNPLPEGVRQHMELNFGADFSGVRIHTDDPAVQLTRLLRANAFTQSNEIFFNQGRFAPGTPAGDRLLAHELTHTIQQGAVSPQDTQLQAEPATVQRQEEDDQASILIRPELLDAIRLARGEIGKVNAKQTTADKTRVGWERLVEYFFTAFGQKELIHPDVIKFIRKGKDVMPSWCGIFIWWAYKQAGIPIPDWKLGMSVVDLVKQRKPGELPQKGDIAYRHEPFQHFAMVTGVESPTTAAGKDFKSIRVATVNGNTSGNDNIGGQIEEKWEPISRWTGFFDPVGKLDMPDVPLVRTSVEPEPSATAAEQGAEAAEPAVETPPTDVSGLAEAVTTEPDLPAEGETDVPTEPPEPLPEPQAEPETELPPEPAVPPAEEAAVVEPLPLDGPSDTAMVGFTEASPSQMAATQPGLGAALDSKIQQEQQEQADNAPVLVAKTNGSVDEGLTPPDQIPVPSDSQIGDGVTGAEPGELTAAPHENKGAPPSNEANEKELDKRDEGGFLSWLRDNMKDFLDNIRTKDPGVNTKAGERPNVQLEGEADPGRMAEQRQDAQAQMIGQRDASTAAFKNHPGQQNIQPKQINEQQSAAPSPEATVSIETQPDSGVADYADAPLTADVRQKADELLQPNLQTNLAAAKTQTEQAADERDTDKAAEIAKAEEETAKINQKADADQRNIVIENRGKVAQQQKEGIESAYDQANEFATSADSEQTAARKEIGEKVKDSEGQARDELDKGEAEADKKKQESEKEAADKKKELEKEQEDDSWWDRVASAIKKAVKAITAAIDFIFTKLREAVKTIIEKAKQAAIGLINAARNWVVDKLNKFRDWAKQQVDTYLKDRFPGLAARINGAIDAAVDTAITGVNFVADTAIAGVEALAKGLAAALDKVLQVFQTALKAAVQIAGAVLTGDFAEALRIAIQAACEIAGIDPQPIFDFIDRAAAQITNILKHPKEFLNNVMEAVAGGVRGFVKNIKKHLIGGLLGWLTGALSEVAITLPETFDVKGVFSLVMQILGLTYENIKAKVIKKFPPAATVFSLVEKGFVIIKRLITEGPMALWEEAKAALSNLKEIVLGGIRSFVITTVIKEAVTWLLGLLNPAGALVKILKLIFDFVMFLVERFEQIKDFVVSVYNSVAAIASGSLGPAKAAVEDALARSLPVVIGLLASLAGLGGIGKTVKNIIGKVANPVHKVVDKVIDKIIAFVKKLLKKGKAAAKKVKEKLVQWWKAKTAFTGADGKRHKLFFRGKEKSAKLRIASEEADYRDFLSRLKIKSSDPKKEEKGKAKSSAQGILNTIESLKKQGKANDPDSGAKTSDFEEQLTLLAAQSTILMETEGGDLPESTPPVFGGRTSAGFATSVDVPILTQKGPKGTPADTNLETPVFAILRQRYESPSSKRRFYKLGHLLSSLLHGTGDDFKNLTPQSESGNQLFERQVESRVKKVILDKKEPGIGRFSAQAMYGSQPNKENLLKTIEETDPEPFKTRKRNIVEAEDKVPLTVKAEFTQIDKKGDPVPGGLTFSTPIPNDIRRVYTAYSVK
jgi:uncharacterized protein DUF4157